MTATTTPKEFSLAFVKKEKLAHDVYCFFFDGKKSDIDFLPGQYVRIILSVVNPDEKGNVRSFSITSSPLQKDYFTIVTKITKSAFKKTLSEIIPGTEVRFFGPVGRFIFSEEETAPHVFLAGGIGVTPFHSMFYFAFAKKLAIPITMLASFSKVEDMIFYNELTAIANQNQAIKVVYTITQTENSQMLWQGETGRISQDLIKKYVSDPLVPSYYIAGPPKMVEATEELVKSMGVSQDKIKKENFVGY